MSAGLGGGRYTHHGRGPTHTPHPARSSGRPAWVPLEPDSQVMSLPLQPGAGGLGGSVRAWPHLGEQAFPSQPVSPSSLAPAQSRLPWGRFTQLIVGLSSGLLGLFVTGSLFGCCSGPQSSRTGREHCPEAESKAPVKCVLWGEDRAPDLLVYLAVSSGT